MVGTPPASIVDPAEQARCDADAEQKRLADSRAAAREAALAEAQATKEEAAAASNNRAAAAERVRAALARAAKARAEKQLVIDFCLSQPLKYSSSSYSKMEW